MKKIISVLLAAVIMVAACAFTGCKSESKIDKTKTQLYVSNYDAGIGRTWIEALAQAFTEDFANYSFEEGKTGVQVIIDHNRTDTGAKLLSDIGSSNNNVFFVEGVDYPAISSNGGARDITNIMTQGAITGVDASGNFTREDKAIETKIDSSMLSYLDRDTSDGKKYYGLPYYLSVSGFLYDVDLWNQNYYYFAKDAAPSEYVIKAVAEGTDLAAAKALYNAAITSVATNPLTLVNDQGFTKAAEGNLELGLSAGPDGLYDTYDDGMPATLDEFYLLMNKMVADSITPLIWTGKFAGYADRFTNAIWQAAEGVDGLEVYYSLNGTMDNLVKLDNAGKVIYKADGVTPDTESYTFNGGANDGYNAQRSLAKYYALQFADKVATTDAWVETGSGYSSAISHIQAQSTYITSINRTDGGNRIAMLADGGWWQQESDQTFSIMGNKNSAHSKYNREFSFLAAPNPTIDRLVERKTDEIKNTIVSMADSFCLVNNNLKEGSARLAIAEAFVSYVHSDKCLNIFTEKTNIRRAMNYQLSDTTESLLTPYGKNFFRYTEASNIVYPYSSNTLFHNNYQYLSNTPNGYNWHALFVSQESVEPFYPITQLHDSANRRKGLDGKSYFEGLYRYYKENVWPKLAK